MIFKWAICVLIHIYMQNTMMTSYVIVIAIINIIVWCWNIREYRYMHAVVVYYFWACIYNIYSCVFALVWMCSVCDMNKILWLLVDICKTKEHTTVWPKQTKSSRLIIIWSVGETWHVVRLANNFTAIIKLSVFVWRITEFDWTISILFFSTKIWQILKLL